MPSAPSTPSVPALLSYDIVDVFAETPYAGNQLAVVHEAADLPDEALLAIAREFGFSETTFPVSLDEGRYRNRIFTPGGEIPFAGHPTLGTAWVLRHRGLLAGAEVVQECGAGEIGVRFDGDAVELSAAPRDLVGPLADDVTETLLAELGLGAEDRDGEAWLAGTGLTFVHLPVRDEAVARAVLGRRTVRESASLPETGDPLEGVNLYAATPGPDGVEVHSRVFVPGLVGAEDAATGSAAAGLGMALQGRGLIGESGSYRITQGVEMGRPSRLTGRLEGGRVYVAGRVHAIARGELRSPAGEPGT